MIVLVVAAAIAVLAIVGVVIAIYSRHTANTAGTDAGLIGPTAVSTGSVHGGLGTIPTVVIDGQDQKQYSGVLCAWQGGKLTFSFPGVKAWISDTDPPVVHEVDLQFNGGHLNMDDKYPDLSSAQATKNATKNGTSYRITGTAVDLTNTSQVVKKPFEIDVTCP
jgi:lipoprotein LpqH